jgi:adenylylsulfate kinase-like enzyme
VAVLESDALRQIFTPNPTYDDTGRDSFYRQMVYVGSLLTQHGVPVIFDATANLRRYRDWARQKIARFVEVHLDCSLEICVARDPKGVYRRAREAGSNNVPGLQAAYEAPEHPEVLIQGDSPSVAAGRVIAELERRGYLKAS